MRFREINRLSLLCRRSAGSEIISAEKSSALLNKLESQLPTENDIRRKLGNDLPTKIKEDLKEEIKALNMCESQIMKDLKERELKKYLESVERLSSNRYAVMFKMDEQTEVDRIETVRENFRKMPYYESEKLSSFNTEELARFPPEVRKKAIHEDTENLLSTLEKAELTMRNYNEKMPLTKKIKYQYEESAKLKQFRKQQREKYLNFATEQSDETLENSASDITNVPAPVHELHLVEKYDDDVTAEVIRRTDLTDEFTREPWEEMKWKRYRMFATILLFLSLLPAYCYVEYKNQQKTGGFQGVFLGMDKRVL